MSEHGKSLLIVDDDAGVVEWLCDELSAIGHRPTGVTSGAEALVCLARGGVDLVISDVEMPGMRGPELLRAIHAQNPAQLVLLITAFGTIELAVESVRAGACDFIAKPFKFEALVQKIDRALSDPANEQSPLLAEMTVEQVEKEHLRRVLRRTSGNKTQAAQILGLDRRTVYRKVAELGLGAPKK